MKTNKDKMTVLMITRHDIRTEMTLKGKHFENVDEFTNIDIKIKSDKRSTEELMSKFNRAKTGFDIYISDLTTLS